MLFFKPMTQLKTISWIILALIILYNHVLRQQHPLISDAIGTWIFGTIESGIAYLESLHDPVSIDQEDGWSALFQMLLPGLIILLRAFRALIRTLVHLEYSYASEGFASFDLGQRLYQFLQVFWSEEFQ
jgi:hypothetical protein